MFNSHRNLVDPQPAQGSLHAGTLCERHWQMMTRSFATGTEQQQQGKISPFAACGCDDDGSRDEGALPTCTVVSPLGGGCCGCGGAL